MTSLLGDGWFYISTGGFVTSCMLFVYLLGQYRAAVEAEDEAETTADLPEPVPVKSAPAPERVYVPKAVAEALPPKPLPSVTAAPADTPMLSPVAEAKKQAAVTGQTTTGGISPAVVYLQNIKEQMGRLDKELAGLKSSAVQQTTQGDSILKALQALTARVESLAQAQAEAAAKAAMAPVASSPAAAPAPAAEEAPFSPPKRAARKPVAVPAPVVEPAPVLEPAPVVEAAPAPEPQTAPDPIVESVPELVPAPDPEPKSHPAFDETMVLEPAKAEEIKLQIPSEPVAAAEPAPLSDSASQPSAAPVASAAAEAEAAPAPRRKGPVWPI